MTNAHVPFVAMFSIDTISRTRRKWLFSSFWGNNYGVDKAFKHAQSA